MKKKAFEKDGYYERRLAELCQAGVDGRRAAEIAAQEIRQFGIDRRSFWRRLLGRDEEPKNAK